MTRSLILLILIFIIINTTPWNLTESVISYPHPALHNLFGARSPSLSLDINWKPEYISATTPEALDCDTCAGIGCKTQGEGTSFVSSSSLLLLLLCTLAARAEVPLDATRLAFRHFCSRTRGTPHRARPAIRDGERPRAGVTGGGGHLLPLSKVGRCPLHHPTPPHSSWRTSELPEKKNKKKPCFLLLSQGVSPCLSPTFKGIWASDYWSASVVARTSGGAWGADAALSLISAPGAGRVIRQD